MANVDKTDVTELDELLKGIAKDAREEAESLLEKAKSYVAERKAAAEKKLQEVRSDAEEKLAKQIEEIKRSKKSSIIVETRRISLRTRDHIIREITERVKIRLQNLIKEPRYKEILVNWIAEAAIGLNTDKAIVNASNEERSLLSEKLLRESEKKIEELTGNKVSLSIEQGKPLLIQGIMVTSWDRKTAFNNQINTRLLRYQTEIRKKIYDTLFKE